MVLQGLGNLNGTSPIAVGLDHADHLRLGLEERAEVVQVVDDGTEIHFQNGFMDFLLQQFADLLEAKAAGTLQQDDLVVQLAEVSALQEGGSGGEERFFADREQIGLGRDFVADANEFLDAPLGQQGVHLGIKVCGTVATLGYVAQDERAPAPLLVRATVHEVKSYVKRIDIGVIGVVDERTPPLALLHLQPHGHRFQVQHPLGELFGGDAQIQSRGGTDDAVLDAGLVDEGNGVASLRTFIYIGDGGLCPTRLDILDEHGHIGIAA